MTMRTFPPFSPAAFLLLAFLLAPLPWPRDAAAAPSVETAKLKGGGYTLDPDHSKVVFGIGHLGFSTYWGSFPKLSGTLDFHPDAPEKSRIDVTIDIGAVETSNATLNRELVSAKFFDAARFPKARFVSETITVPGPGKAIVNGRLELRGQTRPVTLDVTFNGGGDNPISKRFSLGFDARTTIRRSEFGIDAYLPAVGDEVTLLIGAELYQP